MSNVRTPSVARWKAGGRFSIRHNWTVFALLRLLSKSARFEGLSHFARKLETEGVSPTNHCWCQKTRVIALSCGIIVHSLVLSQSTRVADRRTDRHTELRQLIQR